MDIICSENHFFVFSGSREMVDNMNPFDGENIVYIRNTHTHQSHW